MSSMHNPAHPGEVLRDYLPEGLGVSDAAKRLGVTRQALSALINGRAGVSAVLAGYADELRSVAGAQAAAKGEATRVAE
jgi:plasmid maintenance system antidote protein VapI